MSAFDLSPAERAAAADHVKRATAEAANAGLPAGTAQRALRRAAVIGAGTIGHLAARVLALRGHHVTVIDQTPERLALLNGAVETSTSMDDIGTFEWVVEATGQQAVLSTLLERSSTGATLLLLGLPYSAETFSFESIVAYDRSVLGSVGSNGADFDEALATLPHIDTSPFLGAAYPLAEFEQAWSMVRSRRRLKVMIKADAAV